MESTSILFASTDSPGKPRIALQRITMVGYGSRRKAPTQAADQGAEESTGTGQAGSIRCFPEMGSRSFHSPRELSWLRLERNRQANPRMAISFSFKKQKMVGRQPG